MYVCVARSSTFTVWASESTHYWYCRFCFIIHVGRVTQGVYCLPCLVLNQQDFLHQLVDRTRHHCHQLTWACFHPVSVRRWGGGIGTCSRSVSVGKRDRHEEKHRHRERGKGRRNNVTCTWYTSNHTNLPGLFHSSCWCRLESHWWNCSISAVSLRPEMILGSLWAARSRQMNGQGQRTQVH